MSVFTGTKWPEPLIYRGLKVFVPVYGNRGQIVPGICLYGDKSQETVDLQGFDGFCPRLSPEQENRGQNGPFENARKTGLF